MNVTQMLSTQTYSVHHNPNCPMPFLVRLIGHEQIMLDLQPHGNTRDVCGYGKTFIKAAKSAFKQKNKTK